jgi:hypothetical protein
VPAAVGAVDEDEGTDVEPVDEGATDAPAQDA